MGIIICSRPRRHFPPQPTPTIRVGQCYVCDSPVDFVLGFRRSYYKGLSSPFRKVYIQVPTTLLLFSAHLAWDDVVNEP